MRAVAVLGVFVACSSGTDGKPGGLVAPVESTPVAVVTTPTPTPTPTMRMQASGRVLGKAGEPARLCVRDVEGAWPPRCEGVPLIGWDWAKAGDPVVVETTRWGDFHVIGDFDGEALTLSEPPSAAHGRPSPRRLATACPEPAGGWTVPNRAQATAADIEAVHQRAQALPGFASMWLSGEAPVVVNVALSGEAERHTAALRERWGGALCVVRRELDPAALARVAAEVKQAVSELGLGWRSSTIERASGAIHVEVVSVDADAQARLDQRFGVGVVVPWPLLRPYPEVEPSRAGQPCTDGEFIAHGCLCNDRQCMDICCVDSTCSHGASADEASPKCIDRR